TAAREADDQGSLTDSPHRSNLPPVPRYDLGPKPHLGYTESRIDRAAERRADTAWLNEQFNGAKTAAYVIGGELIVLKKTGSEIHDPAFTPDEVRALAPVNEQVFLGTFNGGAHFGIGITQANAEK